MRQQYSELQAFVPGKGQITIWRGRTYRQALSERANRGLRFFQGSKVSVAESVSTLVKPLGWMGARYG